MGSFKAFGRNQRLEGARAKRIQSGRASLGSSFSRSRRLLSVQAAPTHWTATDSNLFDAQNGPMANLGTGLVGRLPDFCQQWRQYFPARIRVSGIRIPQRHGGHVQVKSLAG